MTTDTTPTIADFRPVVLKVLRDGQERSVSGVCNPVADDMNLSEAIRAERIASGQHRWVNRINWACSADIRDFYGALRERGAERGVFITSSKFTEDAKRTARKYNGEIVLIDGIRLTSLMLNYGVAVQKTREFTLFEIDEDFFEADLI